MCLDNCLRDWVVVLEEFGGQICHISRQKHIFTSYHCYPLVALNITDITQQQDYVEFVAEETGLKFHSQLYIPVRNCSLSAICLINYWLTGDM